MKLLCVCFVVALFAVSSATVYSQTTPPNAKRYSKDGVAFDYLPDWTMLDDSNGDAQQLTLAKSSTEAQIIVFVDRRRTAPEKLPKARKSIIDPYISSRARQLIAMGAKPEPSPDSIDIATTKAEGVSIKATLGGEVGAAKIYWALINERVVVLTYFGPDKELKKYEPLWALVRSTLQIDAKGKPGAKPSPSPKQ